MKKLVLPFLLLLLISACSPAVPTSTSSSDNVGLGTTSPTLETGLVLATAQPSIWGKFGLTGRLILIAFNQFGNNLISLDLASGAMTLLYQAPQGSLLTGAWVSPDGKQIVMVYAPPPSEDGTYTLTNLYLMPSDASTLPEILIPSVTANDAFYNATWAPDGQSIYSSHFLQGDSPKNTPDHYEVDKISLDGQVTQVIQNGVWPVVSHDATKIAYLTANPTTTTNYLYIAGIDGSNPSPVIPVATFLSVDAHLFTADGKNLIFSAVNPTSNTPPSTTLLDKLFGISVASAHNVPSDWYEQNLAGGSPLRLTQVADTGMNASLSPDGKNMAFISSQGLCDYNFASGNTQVLSNIVFIGSIDWIQ